MASVAVGLLQLTTNKFDVTRGTDWIARYLRELVSTKKPLLGIHPVTAVLL